MSIIPLKVTNFIRFNFVVIIGLFDFPASFLPVIANIGIANTRTGKQYNIPFFTCLINSSFPTISAIIEKLKKQPMVNTAMEVAMIWAVKIVVRFIVLVVLKFMKTKLA